jgi:hypothetical protein
MRVRFDDWSQILMFSETSPLINEMAFTTLVGRQCRFENIKAVRRRKWWNPLTWLSNEFLVTYEFRVETPSEERERIQGVIALKEKRESEFRVDGAT